jgi:RNA polymerase sigma-70 factor, ECF subfamily
MQQENIVEIIEKIRLGHSDQFRKLVEISQSMIYSLAFRLLCDEDEAKDIVQETFVKVWRNLNSFDTKMKFSTWIYTIATRLCYDRLRVWRRKSVFRIFTTENEMQLDIPSLENVENEVINADLRRVIAKLTSGLSLKQKLVFTLSEIECLEIEEIIAITGLSAEKIKSNLYLARQSIRKKLERM